MMDEAAVLEYSECNELLVSSAGLSADLTLAVTGRKPSNRDLAIEVALRCSDDWGEMVAQIASSRGYDAALKLGLLIQRRVILENTARVRDQLPN